MEWAVADVLGYEGTTIPDVVPMPHWTWDGLQS
jgi:hypothetical protein